MKKKLIIVGGANGVGKTTFAYQCEYGQVMVVDEEYYKIFLEAFK